jgi:hypothetical protein
MRTAVVHVSSSRRDETGCKDKTHFSVLNRLGVLRVLLVLEFELELEQALLVLCGA